MCGIVGFINPPNKKASLEILQRMSRTIAHRGPDDHGEEIVKNVGLANRRLAIIDLTKEAHMPMSDRNKKIWITYNGEVYNFPQLKKDLIRKGYRFFSKSDTEVILYLYEAYGLGAIEKLRGMFAIAIWDEREKQLILARDHFGIKPLHYFWDGEFFIFGSEIKAILAHPWVKKILNSEALSQYFSIGFGAIPSPNTIFEGIKKLPPAHYAVLKGGRLTIRRYWSLEKVKDKNISEDEAKRHLLKLIDSSVKSQLVSDVPLGAFLSGGIDSSLIVAFMSRHSLRKVKTFTIGFDDPNFDESPYAQTVADFYKTDHHSKKFKIKDLLEALKEVVKKLDEPLADASILPVYLLSEFTRKRVTVALAGDGGDELFGGYPTYIAHKINDFLPFIPPSFFSLFVGFEMLNKFWLAKHAPSFSLSYKLGRLASGWNREIVERHLNFMGPIPLQTKPLLFTPEILRKIGQIDPAFSWAKGIFERAKNFDQQKKLQFFDLYSYLSEDSLVKTDRASSFNSLEVRVPFLTKEIAEFVFSLPSEYLLKGFRLKYLLKAAAREVLPEAIIERPKKGFGIPLHLWFRTALKNELREKLSERYLKKQGIFNSHFVNKLINDHLSGAEDNRMVLWNLLIFQYWYDRWFK